MGVLSPNVCMHAEAVIHPPTTFVKIWETPPNIYRVESDKSTLFGPIILKIIGEPVKLLTVQHPMGNFPNF